MMKKNTAALILFMLAFASAALAANVASVTTTASTTSATTGTNVVITAVSSADSDTVSNVQIQLIKDSGTGNGSCTGSGDFSITDPASPYYYTASVSTSGTTKTFTFTVGTCGTYTYHVADTWSGGSKSSTSDTIEFIAPTAMSVQSNVSAVQINTSQTFGLTMDITNSQGSQITTLYNLSVPSNLTASGDPTSDTAKNISASSTATLSWTITHSQCFTGSKAVTLTLGDNTNASYIIVTGNSSCAAVTAASNGTTPSSTGGGGGGAPSGTTVTHYSKKHSIKIPSIAANKKAEVEITKSYETGVKKIVISVKNSVTNIEIVITKPDSKPSEVSDPAGKIYSYLQINKANITDNDISDVTIDFQIEKSWITTNNINTSTIALARYTNSWTRLPTTSAGSNTTHEFYQAVSPGMSVFAITAGAVGEAVPTEEPVTTPPTTTPPATTPPAEQPAAPGAGVQLPKIGMDILIGIIVAGIIILLGILYYKGKILKKEVYSFGRKK